MNLNSKAWSSGPGSLMVVYEIILEVPGLVMDLHRCIVDWRLFYSCGGNV